MSDYRLGHLGPFPFKDCPRCDRHWPLAAYRGFDICFYCLNKEEK